MYVRMAGRWTYLAVVLDLYAWRIVGWNLSTTPDSAGEASQWEVQGRSSP
ncbi:MAG: IS3 family transposase, partial [Nitrospirales bacterium]|nr:IS3 family transposase [Nitrospirales bacterium]